MITPEEIKGILEREIPDSVVEVGDMTGGGDHFQVIVVSPEFEGKRLVQQHQLVYKALGKVLDGDAIHALALRTYTPEAWQGAL
ncbi:MAG: BolA family transcriptional regulator [Candidatus Tectomicrobia bacterium]|uniref:BolA family transcriptional regulator n=1 Tax=Tectimicrobiota bacterium TaxID=2528274 RepID=A0A932GRJ8_UNCTE|nr:BolA family transcriptional regulator [Candidatus Tectomicrobia bacterium]